MTPPTLHEPPRGLPVFRLHVRKLGRLLRPELLGLAVLLCVAPILGFVAVFLDAEPISYPQGLNFIVLLAAFLVPFRIWHGERLFDGAPLWTLPVERRRHALLIVAAGAVWVVVLSLAAVAAFNTLALASGGLTAGDALGPPRAAGAGLWLCLVPVGGAMVAYAFASALAVGLRYPLRWAVGCLVATTLFTFVALGSGPQSTIVGLVYGDLGLDRLLTGGVLGFMTGPREAGAAPTAGRWMLALSFWLGLGLTAVALASLRHRERSVDP